MKDKTIQSKIFTDDFLKVGVNDKDLENIIKEHPECDRAYIVSGCTKERRETIENIYETYQYEKYSDNNFLKEIKTNFNSRTWEMCLACFFLDRRITLQEKTKEEKQKGIPDIIIDHLNCFIYIEATAINHNKINFVLGIPKEHGRVKLFSLTDEPIKKNLEGLYKKIVNCLKEKTIKKDGTLKYKNYIEYEPYIIAINIASSEFLIRHFIKYLNNKETNLDLFNNSHVSAIILCDTPCIVDLDELGKRMIIIHNSKADCHIDPKNFSFFTTMES